MDISLKRSFVSKDFKIKNFSDIEPYFTKLKESDLSSPNKIQEWLINRSELEAIVSEDLAWRYIKMNCDTNNKDAAESFNHFITTIEPEISKISNELDKMLMHPNVSKFINASKYFTLIRRVRKDVELFRKENIPLEAQMQQKEQEYGQIASQMTIDYNGEEITLQKASNLLRDTDRKVRKNVYMLINERRMVDSERLNNLLSELISIRHKIAKNTGFDNFRDYKFRSMGRFDYSVQDCKDFHATVANTVKPVVNNILKLRKENLNLDELKPWDLQVDENLAEPLNPFKNSDELINKTILCFKNIYPEFGVFLNHMNKMGYLDLDSRIGKAPGGFNYPLHESNVPFIFMNATGNLRDVVTMLHEGGHAIHSFLSSNLELVEFKDTPSEVAELASMTMELISMEHWNLFFDDEYELKRAKREHLIDVISVLPWVATVDKFQHYLYENPNHTNEEREQAWLKISKELGSDLINFEGIEKFKSYQWQRQLHIFEVPFYYIEYGFAQLGAIAIWKNFKENPKLAIENYRSALKLGYTTTIPDIYKAAGIKFNFSQDYIKELMDFVQEELEKLN